MIDFKNIADFKGLKIKLASPEEILSWSHGEVTKPETINYRTWRPEKDGLFCEKIFGPQHDYECYCGKYKKIRFKGVICDKCGVEITTSKVRRERMGHISLAAPVTHLWYLKNAPSALSLILDVPQRDLEAVVYFTKYLITSVDSDKRKIAITNLEANVEKRKLDVIKNSKLLIEAEKAKKDKDKKALTKKIKNQEQLLIAQKEQDVNFKQIIQKLDNDSLSEQKRIETLGQYLKEKITDLAVLSTLTDEEEFYLTQFEASDFFEAKMGAEAILEVLQKIDLPLTVKSLKKEVKKTSSKIKKKKLMQKIRLMNSMAKNDINPSWTILTHVPVIPPDLRPMVQLTGGRFATSDLNDLYRRLINRNNRLKKLLKLGAPEIILRNEKRMLQESVDTLIDAQKSANNRRRSSKRVPRSLSDLLRSKKGRFRRNLLGKRVDYSGRSVIVVGPELKLDEVGLPKEIALELYRPFVLRQLMQRGLAPNIKSAKNLIDHRINEVYDILDQVTKDSYVLLNRAPTLHKLSIQAFKPILIDGLAIRLHPCVCSGFNADFDGDQMGVHLPLSKPSIKEAKTIMVPSKNLLKPSDSSPTSVPAKEMAVGCYYVTSVRQSDLALQEGADLKDLPIFTDTSEVTLAYQTEKIDLRQLVAVRIENKIVKTTYGRIWFNSILPSEFGFVNEAMAGNSLKSLIIKSLEIAGQKKTVKLIDDLKDIGFEGYTLSGISLSIQDYGLLSSKDQIIKQADSQINQIEQNFKMGLISNEERKRLSQNIWMETTEKIAEDTWATLESDSPIKIIAAAGIKRASKDQIKQLSGMRGLMVDPTGKIVELPTKSNFREGLSVYEYVTGARGTRKGLADTALKTADAGYLTRRLVDASHTSLIREEDCGTNRFITINKNEKNRERYFARRLFGRQLATDVVDSKTNEVIAKKGDLIDENLSLIIENNENIVAVNVRSPLSCNTQNGICQHCYGWDLSDRKLVEIGTPVGVLAAQSIGEPGTQLTMRTKHTGGVVGVDVTQGLPRVQELFEVRTPKIPSPMAEVSGRVKVKENIDGFEIKLTGKDINNVEKTITYLLPSNVNLLVADGDLVAAGTQLSSGSLDVQEILKIQGMDAARSYLINSIQFVYESQGIGIHDKHVEVIVKEMSDKIKIEDPCDSDFLYGQLVTRASYTEENKRIKAEGGKPARGHKVLLGLIKSALTTSSWLSAASFQQTTGVLTDASLLAKVDHLIGLKENVIIGRLIPVTKQRLAQAK